MSEDDKEDNVEAENKMEVSDTPEKESKKVKQNTPKSGKKISEKRTPAEKRKSLSHMKKSPGSGKKRK